MNNKLLKLVNKIIFYLFMLMMVSMMNYRSLLVDKFLGKYTDCIGCYKTWVLSVDAKIVFVLLIILSFASIVKSYVIRVMLRMFILCSVLYYLFDIYLYKSLHQRLYFSDIFKYFNGETIKDVFINDIGSYLRLFIILTFILMFIFLHKNIKFKLFDKLVVSLLLIIMLSLTLFIKESTYVHNIGLRNIVVINSKSTVTVDYSDETVQKLDKKEAEFISLTCNADGVNSQKNIILLVWESLSMYQSNLFSGLNDWTPQLDKIAVKNRYYTNFFANNFTSSQGRIALLTGEKTFNHIEPYLFGKTRVGFWNTQRTVPILFKNNGYSTSFLDAADLKFTQTGEYMRAIGFDYIEGHDYIGYKNKPRFAFKSVADGVLLTRVLEYVREQKEPFFSTVITVTTHPPFINPKTKKASQKEAVQYTDNAVYQFYQSLEEVNYFENGILIIVSDHRSMTPVSKKENKRFGKQAVARIPMVVIDKSYKGVPKSTEYLQQSDFLNSFEYLISDEHCYRKGEGNIFSNPAISASCVFHNRGDYRDNINVICEEGKQIATIKLNGDNTKVIDGSIDQNEAIVDRINYFRLDAIKRHTQLFDGQK